jgi:hypothetical protein
VASGGHRPPAARRATLRSGDRARRARGRRGPGTDRRVAHQALQVGPVGYLREDEALDRIAARTELGLADDATVALVQLGAGNIDDVHSTLGRTIELLGELGIEAVVTRSVIAARDAACPAHVHAISAYPLARYFAAFDLAVAASGYNTFHELSAAAVPTVFVPNLATSTDDQLARARWAEQVGTGACVVDPSTAELAKALQRFADADERARARDRALALHAPNGAEAAMAAIEQLLHDGGAGLPRPVNGCPGHPGHTEACTRGGRGRAGHRRVAPPAGHHRVAHPDAHDRVAGPATDPPRAPVTHGNPAAPQPHGTHDPPEARRTPHDHQGPATRRLGRRKPAGPPGGGGLFRLLPVERQRADAPATAAVGTDTQAAERLHGSAPPARGMLDSPRELERSSRSSAW